DDPIGAYRSPEIPHPLLSEPIDGASVLAPGCEHALLALEDDRQVRRQGTAAAALSCAAHAEHHPQAPAIRALRARKAHPDPAVVGARTALELHLRVVPVEVEIDRAADLGPQETAARAQTSVGILGRRSKAGGWRRRHANNESGSEQRRHSCAKRIAIHLRESTPASPTEPSRAWRA